MVTLRKTDNGTCVEVTSPLGDKIAFPVATLVALGIFLWGNWYFRAYNHLVLLLGLWLSVLVFHTVRVFRTRIVVSKSKIEVRRIRKGEVLISSGVRPVKNGTVINLLNSTDEIEFRFSRYLGHRGRLYEVLRSYFEEEKRRSQALGN